MFLREDLPIDGIREKYSRFQNCAAAFYSHYSLWKHCIQLGRDITIFEHDAVLHNSIPINSFKYVMNIGEPSYGKYNTPPLFGVNDLTGQIINTKQRWSVVFTVRRFSNIHYILE